jgi:hypothetical protein
MMGGMGMGMEGISFYNRRATVILDQIIQHGVTTVLDKNEIKRQQSLQHAHDMYAHVDILGLHRISRIQHYGLHFAKYVGRIARGNAETKTLDETLVDIALVALSAANSLNMELYARNSALSDFENLASSTGKFCDGAEKFDHMEDCHESIRDALVEIFSWVVQRAKSEGIGLESAIPSRREFLRQRQVFHFPAE